MHRTVQASLRHKIGKKCLQDKRARERRPTTAKIGRNERGRQPCHPAPRVLQEAQFLLICSPFYFCCKHFFRGLGETPARDKPIKEGKGTVPTVWFVCLALNFLHFSAPIFLFYEIKNLCRIFGKISIADTFRLLT